MKDFGKFIFNCSLFFLLIGIIVFLFWKVVIWKRQENCYKPEVTTIVLGNSRVQYGLDDSFSQKIMNLAVNADNMNIMYFKMKMMVKINPQIKKVIVNADHVTLSDYFKGVEYKLHPYYFDVIDFSDYLGLLKHDRQILINPFYWIKILYPILSIRKPINFQDLGIGGFSRLERDKLNEALNIEIEKKHHSYTFDEYQLEYLHKIVRFCQSHAITVEFIGMPTYPSTNLHNTVNIVNEYLKNEYPNIKNQDYTKIELPDSCYGDITHINYRGAETLKEVLKLEIELP